MGKTRVFAQTPRPANFAVAIAAGLVEAGFLAFLVGTKGSSGVVSGLQAGS